MIIPTYNRRAILEKVLLSLDDQTYPSGDFEVLVVDDGSSDDTLRMLSDLQGSLSYGLITLSTGRLPGSEAGNPSRGRNIAILAASGEVVIFLDSDMVVCKGFIAAHMEAHKKGNEVVHGPFIQTANFEDPRSERRRITDFSRAIFATGNSSVRREWLIKAGLFDEDFTEYGWEDLEFGIRLKALGLVPVHAKDAIGYHYKNESHEYQLESAIAREESRARMAAVFLRKHPTFEVKAMVLDLWLYYMLENLLTLGGWPDWKPTRRLIERLSKKGRSPLILFLAKFVTGHAYTKVLKSALHGER